MAKRSKVVLVTGTSSGFGLLIAVRLAAAGHTVYASMRNSAKKNILLNAARHAKCEQNIKVLTLDVTDPETIQSAIREIFANSRALDVLVNNAGFGMSGFFEDVTTEDYQKQFEVNFFGVLNVTRAVVPFMRGKREGLIVNISSMASFSGTPCFSAYCASKWALEGFSECLYMELAPLGIKVALVEPGSYRTSIFEGNARYGKNFHTRESPYYESSQKLKQLVQAHIQKSTRNPDQVAAVVLQVIEASAPSFRNIVGWDQKLRRALLRLIPFKLYAWIINKALGRLE